MYTALPGHYDFKIIIIYHHVAFRLIFRMKNLDIDFSDVDAFISNKSSTESSGGIECTVNA